MLDITEVSVISIDKTDETWAIEGEILFESDLTSAFSVNYNPDYDELEELEIEIEPGRYDKNRLKEMIVNAALHDDE